MVSLIEENLVLDAFGIVFFSRFVNSFSTTKSPVNPNSQGDGFGTQAR